MTLKSRIIRLWWGSSFFGTFDYALMKGWLPARLQKTEPYCLGQKPYVFGESFERIRWN